jgi:ArsR family transcriptional regulator
MNKDYSRAIPDKWGEMALVFEALGNEHRQRILLTFEKNEELSIKDIETVSTLERTSVVYHLKVLEKAKVLLPKKVGKFVYYKINTDIIKFTCLNTVDYIQKHFE